MPADEPVASTLPDTSRALGKSCKKSWRRRLGCGCLTFLLSLGVGLVVLEWILRENVGHFLGAPAEAYLMYEMDGDRSFRLTPGWRGEMTIDGQMTKIRINSRGMRGGEIAPKARGETRVLVIGDSLVFGRGVEEDRTFPARLEALLPPNTTVLNAGVPGHGLRDMVRSLERQLDLDPDVIVACTYLGNDFVDDCREYTAITEGFILSGPMARLAHTSTRFRLTMRYRTVYLFEKLLTDYVPSIAFDRSELEQTPEEIAAVELFPPEAQRRGCLFVDRRDEDALIQKILNRCRESFLAVQKLAAGKPLLLVLIPAKWQIDETEWRLRLQEQSLDADQHEFGVTQRRLVALAKTLGVEVFDLTPSLRDVPNWRTMWLPADRHLSVEGCEHVARRLAPEVKRLTGK